MILKSEQIATIETGIHNKSTTKNPGMLEM